MAAERIDLEAERPRWFDDVIALVTAAAQADVQAGNAPVAAQVPVVRRTPALQLVVGGGC